MNDKLSTNEDPLTKLPLILSYKFYWKYIIREF